MKQVQLGAFNTITDRSPGYGPQLAFHHGKRVHTGAIVRVDYVRKTKKQRMKERMAAEPERYRKTQKAS